MSFFLGVFFTIDSSDGGLRRLLRFGFSPGSWTAPGPSASARGAAWHGPTGGVSERVEIGGEGGRFRFLVPFWCLFGLLVYFLHLASLGRREPARGRWFHGQILGPPFHYHLRTPTVEEWRRQRGTIHASRFCKNHRKSLQGFKEIFAVVP